MIVLWFCEQSKKKNDKYYLAVEKCKGTVHDDLAPVGRLERRLVWWLMRMLKSLGVRLRFARCHVAGSRSNCHNG
jgi:hypothetical protein